jgi:hypothetical protein
LFRRAADVADVVVKFGAVLYMHLLETIRDVLALLASEHEAHLFVPEAWEHGKEVHAADVARAAELLLRADTERMAGQSFNCYDLFVAEEQVARIAKELTGSASVISNLNHGPKHQIDTKKIRSLGMTFGGEKLLRRTVEELIEAQRQAKK